MKIALTDRTVEPHAVLVRVTKFGRTSDSAILRPEDAEFPCEDQALQGIKDGFYTYSSNGDITPSEIRTLLEKGAVTLGNGTTVEVVTFRCCSCKKEFPNPPRYFSEEEHDQWCTECFAAERKDRIAETEAARIELEEAEEAF